MYKSTRAGLGVQTSTQHHYCTLNHGNKKKLIIMTVTIFDNNNANNKNIFPASWGKMSSLHTEGYRI